MTCVFSFLKTQFTFPLHMSMFPSVTHTTILSVAIVRIGCLYERCVFRAGSGHYTAYAVHEGKPHCEHSTLSKRIKHVMATCPILDGCRLSEMLSW